MARPRILSSVGICPRTTVLGQSQSCDSQLRTPSVIGYIDFGPNEQCAHEEYPHMSKMCTRENIANYVLEDPRRKFFACLHFSCSRFSASSLPYSKR